MVLCMLHTTQHAREVTPFPFGVTKCITVTEICQGLFSIVQYQQLAKVYSSSWLRVTWKGK